MKIVFSGRSSAKIIQEAFTKELLSTMEEGTEKDQQECSKGDDVTTSETIKNGSDGEVVDDNMAVSTLTLDNSMDIDGADNTTNEEAGKRHLDCCTNIIIMLDNDNTMIWNFLLLFQTGKP